MTEALTKESLSVEIEHIGGIRHTELELPPGVTVLSGRNATNRTSFLQGIMAAMGSNADRISLKSDADQGHATLRIGDETYTRSLKRTGETTVMGGDPFAKDSELLDLYAFLLKDNPVRRTIENDGDLHEVLMRPIDTDEIEAELRTLREQRQEIEAELQELDDYKQRLPTLEERRTALESDLDDLRSTETELIERKETLEAKFDEAATEGKPERVQELEEKLTAKRTEITELERKLEQQQNLREAAVDELETIDTPSTDKSELRADRDRLERERDRLSDPPRRPADRDSVDEPKRSH